MRNKSVETFLQNGSMKRLPNFNEYFWYAAICRRKLEMPVDAVIRAVNALDLKTFSLENVEILQRMVPTETEVTERIRFYSNQETSGWLLQFDTFKL